jgi:hypothetical protein
MRANGALIAAAPADLVAKGAPNDTIYVADSGNGLFLAAETLRLDAPQSFLAPSAMASLQRTSVVSIGLTDYALLRE